MKKTIFKFPIIFLVLLFSFVLTFVSCASNGDSNDKIGSRDDRIELTLENYEQYIDVSARYYGEGGTWSSLFSRYDYKSVVSSATVTSTSTFVKFYNCSIKVRIVGEYYYTASSKKTTDETIEVSLSIGGSGRASKVENVSNANAHDIKGKGYEVVAVSGYVIVD